MSYRQPKYRLEYNQDGGVYAHTSDWLPELKVMLERRRKYTAGEITNVKVYELVSNYEEMNA